MEKEITIKAVITVEESNGEQVIKITGENLGLEIQKDDGTLHDIEPSADGGFVIFTRDTGIGENAKVYPYLSLEVKNLLE